LVGGVPTCPLYAADEPDPSWGRFPSVSALPEQKALPDPFLGPDGQRVRTIEDWPQQREYLKAMLGGAIASWLTATVAGLLL